MNELQNTSRDAAIRLILGEMGQLLDRVDAASMVMQEGHALLEKDMHGLGAFMGRIEAVLQEAAESAATLQLFARSPAPRETGKRQVPASPASVPVKYLLACCLLSSASVLGGMLFFNRVTIEQAHVGRAVLKSLPFLDQPTRQKLEAAIQKSNQ